MACGIFREWATQTMARLIGDVGRPIRREISIIGRTYWLRGEFLSDCSARPSIKLKGCECLESTQNCHHGRNGNLNFRCIAAVRAKTAQIPRRSPCVGGLHRELRYSAQEALKPTRSVDVPRLQAEFSLRLPPRAPPKFANPTIVPRNAALLQV